MRGGRRLLRAFEQGAVEFASRGCVLLQLVQLRLGVLGLEMVAESSTLASASDEPPEASAEARCQLASISLRSSVAREAAVARSSTCCWPTLPARVPTRPELSRRLRIFCSIFSMSERTCSMRCDTTTLAPSLAETRRCARESM